MSVANQAPSCSLFYISFCRQWALSTVRLGKSRGTVKQCRCNQHRKSPLPTINTRECFLMYHVQNMLCGRSDRIFSKSVICRVAAILTTSVSTCTHGPNTQPNCVSSKLFLACRVAMIRMMRKNRKQTKQHNVEKCRETCAVLCQKPIQAIACLGSCVPEGAAGTTKKFVFTNFFPALNRNTNSTCSTNHDTETAALPHYILSPCLRRCQRVLMSQHRSNTNL